MVSQTNIGRCVLDIWAIIMRHYSIGPGLIIIEAAISTHGYVREEDTDPHDDDEEIVCEELSAQQMEPKSRKYRNPKYWEVGGQSLSSFMSTLSLQSIREKQTSSGVRRLVFCKARWA